MCIVNVTVDGYTYCFDFDTQVINIDATLDSLSVVNLYTAIKDAQDDELAMPYPIVATASGLDTLAAGVKTFLTVTLLDNWEINTLKASGAFAVGGGNLIRADGSDPFLDNPLITYINNLSQAGVVTVVETGVSGLTQSESLQLARLNDMPIFGEAFYAQDLDSLVTKHLQNTRLAP